MVAYIRIFTATVVTEETIGAKSYILRGMQGSLNILLKLNVGGVLIKKRYKIF
jgi:hypothetical protein